MSVAAFITGALLGAFIGWMIGDIRASNRVNRRWTLESYARLQETKYQLGLAGLSLNPKLTEITQK